MVPSEEYINEILEIFDNNNIPKNNRLIYQALHRKAKDFPILPLKEEENIKTR